MNWTLILRIVFLAALIWALAALVGAVPGATLRFGRGNKKCNNRRTWRGRADTANRWVSSGMGAELISTPGTDVPLVGVPLVRF